MFSRLMVREYWIQLILQRIQTKHIQYDLVLYMIQVSALHDTGFPPDPVLTNAIMLLSRIVKMHVCLHFEQR